MVSELLRTYGTLFVSRRDDYAIQQLDGRYRRAGQKLTYGTLQAHLDGLLTLGTYVIDEHGGCRFAVFDDDTGGATLTERLARLLRVQRHLQADGFPSLLEQSRRGGHLWVLTNRRVLASSLRGLLLPYCPPGVEFFPKQHEGGSKYGSLIRLPLGVHQRSGRRYGFVQWDEQAGRFVTVAETVAETLSWLGTVKRATLSFDASSEASALSPSPLRQPPIVSKDAGAAVRAPSLTSIGDWCASQDAVAVLSRYVELDGRGLGCCPFGDHHRDGKDSHPSFRVYRPSHPGGSCWYCYAWGKGGTLFDFFVLWFNSTPRDLWRRILAGEVF